MFVTMEPVSDWIKWGYHLYGLVDLGLGVGFLLVYFLPGSCAQSTEVISLYIVSLLTVIGILTSIGKDPF